MSNEESRPLSPEPSGPLPIKKLHESIINRIAAGEIIHRPASALKELIENSLDAGATSINVTVKDGGMKLLQIQDNGCGIRKVDLPILAERFTTSKLSTFSDLSRLTTYGFRGEALASISFVGHLSVITKTKAETCAWKTHYADGILVGERPGQSEEPKPCAGNDGTTLIVEDLFYNTPTRLSALRSSSEEYARILDVVTKYAVHNPKVSFSCKKAGSPSLDISTPSSSQIHNTIKLLYGHSVAKELVHAKASSISKKGEKKSDNPEAWAAEVYFTSANYQAKKMIFLLFINHRLVESPRMKRAVEGVFTPVLPKGSAPFVYLSLLIDPRSIDVNVHPTKREVHFLNEDAIIEKIADGIQETLAAQSNSRSFQYQTLLTSGVTSSEASSRKRKGKDRDVDEEDHEEEAPTPRVVPQKTASQHKVRTSQNDRTLDSMFPVTHGSRSDSTNKDTQGGETAPRPKTKEVKESECFLTSVLSLRQALVKGKHKLLTEILERHTFVGIVDRDRSLSVIQYSTSLYLINHAALAEEMFYQLGIRQFGDFNRLKLEPPPPLRSLVQIAVDYEDTATHSKLTKDQIVDKIVSILMMRREMLSEYFALDITEEGNIESLPLLLPDYTPSLDNLPNFLMRLGPQVDWTDEAECFGTFLRELALFYTPGPPLISKSPDSPDDAQEKAEKWQIQHVLFPAMRRYLLAPKTLLDHDVVQIASLPDLYKVFERC
ncbi:DNA mismatch repair protein MutL [Pluteus cervinus]|uniref:DNA mismatch repair protein MutL n=1 Tax=Pluteus cervinus TaxID=181527 RepID=A0ACD3AP82_9AGAR|nr:DNA mismatch repair protein MutL [Pluteus cervinus]